jgi:hypothetical protein
MIIMVVIYLNACILWHWGANWRYLGAIRVHFMPHGIVLRCHFAESFSGNQVSVPGLGAATYYNCVRSVPGNGTSFLEPYNMQLWKKWLRKNGLSPSSYAPFIGYPGELCRLHLWAVSYSRFSGRNSLFSLYIWYNNNGCNLPEWMHLVTLGGKLAFSVGHQSSF